MFGVVYDNNGIPAFVPCETGDEAFEKCDELLHKGVLAVIFDFSTNVKGYEAYCKQQIAPDFFTTF